MEWKVLAGIRFLLAWVVCCSHLKWFGISELKILSFYHLDSFSAVLGFLLISGYSIGISVKKRTEGFYQRRLVRLYPLYFFSIIFSLIPFAFLGERIPSPTAEVFVKPEWLDVVSNLFFLQGFTSDPISSNPILWTLSIEVFFYLFAPVLIRMSSRNILILTILSALLYMRYPRLGLPYYSHIKWGIAGLLLLWPWLLGFLYSREEEHRDVLGGLMIGLGCLALAFNSYEENFTSFTYVLSCLAVMYGAKISLPKPVGNAFNYLGDLSYPLYLFHVPAYVLGYSMLKINAPLGLAAFALLVSAAFYHGVDRPLRFRKPA